MWILGSGACPAFLVHPGRFNGAAHVDSILAKSVHSARACPTFLVHTGRFNGAAHVDSLSAKSGHFKPKKKLKVVLKSPKSKTMCILRLPKSLRGGIRKNVTKNNVSAKSWYFEPKTPPEDAKIAQRNPKCAF